MMFSVHEPAHILKPFIRQYLVIDSEDGTENKILPGTSMVMALRYKGEVGHLIDGRKNALPQSVLSGLRKSARIVNYSKNAGTILVTFKEAAATAFFKAPMHELYDDSVALENFISKQKLNELEDRLAEATTTPERITLVEGFLLAQLQNYTTDRLVLSAVQKIESGAGYYKIKTLADDLFISQDAFEKRFRKVTGASPKQFSSIIRMRALIAAVNRHKTLPNWLTAQAISTSRISIKTLNYLQGKHLPIFSDLRFIGKINDFLQGLRFRF